MITLFSSTLSGISGQLVEIEVDVVTGMGSFTVVGLGDIAIQESRERVRSAIKNSGYRFPGGTRITVNLAPADLRKKGPIYDLGIALGILGKEIQYDEEYMKTSLFLGELALDGKIRPVQGALPSVILARDIGMKRVFLPKDNAWEASIIPDVDIISVSCLTEVVDILTKQARPCIVPLLDMQTIPRKTHGVRFEDILGQDQAKRALTIAAAGGHNILMQGPPGSGKTMLAKGLSGILPSLDIEESIEISRIYSVAGLLSKDLPMIRERPFRMIHHAASEISIIGGGRDARPGEISFAHKGVLFLDEFLEFHKSLLEMLRQPLEDGEITINRIHGSARYPARFSLVGAMNPCPCGFLGDREKPCNCTQLQIDKYRSRLSGPILDRVDIFIQVPRIKPGELIKKSDTETTESIRNRVEQAQLVQKRRFLGMNIRRNSEMSNIDIENCASMSPEAIEIAVRSTERLNLSTRVYYRILRVARTIADLDQAESVEVKHILEALSYRGH